MKIVRLYSKPGCHLCEQAEHVIAQVAKRRRFKLQKLDILSDPAYEQKYQSVIPVIEVDGEEIARLRITAFDLEAARAR